MARVLDGVRVIEVAQWWFVPAAGAMLADWGADVIKVEHAFTGDAQRGMVGIGPAGYVEGSFSPLMDHPNRAKYGQQKMLVVRIRDYAYLVPYVESEKEIFLTGNYSCTEDVLAGVTLAKADAGLFQTYKFIVKNELADGSLVEVLQAFGGCSRPISLVYPHGRLLPSRVRAIVDFMVEQTELLKASEATARSPKAKRSR
jgi:hypothetical protein